MKKPDGVIDIFLQPGDYFFSDKDTRIRTILGSCVSIIVWHPQRLIGGMCHYMLSDRKRGPKDALDGRYADEAMAMFIRDIAAAGTKPHEYVVKMFGGGNMFPNAKTYCNASTCTHKNSTVACLSISCRNERVALALAKQNGLKVHSTQLGGTGHRQVIFDVWTGDVWVRHNEIKPNFDITVDF